MYQQKPSFSPGLALRFAFLLCFFGSLAPLQAQLFEWVKQYGALNRTTGYEIEVDSNNHVISAGVFRDVVDFDPGLPVFNLTAAGIRDVYISKLDSAGDFIWAKQLACVSSLSPGRIAIDDTGNVYITGGFSDTVDVDPGPNVLNFVPLGNVDAYVIKLNPMGEFVWARQIGDSLGNVLAADIAVDRQGNVYTTGTFFETVDFDPGPDTLRLSVLAGTSFTSAVYVQKLDGSGNFVWAKSLAGTSLQSTTANTIAVDQSGNVYTGGGFEGVQDFDPGLGSFSLSSVGNQDVFISKLDSAGSFVWAKQFSGNAFKAIGDLKIGNNQAVYGTGWFSGMVDFDPGPDTVIVSSFINSEVFVSKLDSMGDLVWVKAFVGTSTNRGNGMSLDEEDNAYITGVFMGTIDFDPGPDTVSVTAIGSQDIFVSKLDINGEYVWSVQMGGPGNDVGEDIDLDRQGNVYTTGFFRFTSDFDPGSGVFNLTPAGIEDAFVHRLSLCDPSFGSMTVSTCDSYTSPSGDSTWSSSGMYTDVIPNAVGCDSIISIDLTILNSTSDTLSAVVCDSFVSPSGNHIWTSSGIYQDTIPNAIGCDSLLTINLSVNTTVASLSPTACDTYLSPGGKTLTTSGTYLDTIPNTAGCDSLITINLTINNSSSSTIAPSACDTYLSPSGKNWTTSGTYLDTIPNMAGCDSLLTINLTIINSSSSTISPTVCDTYSSPGGKTFTASGTYLDTIPNTAGCDSLLTINLTIINSSSNTISPTVCDTYSSPGGKTLTTSGTYLDTIPNTAGCDSLITINLTVNTTTSTTITPTACDTYLSPGGKTLTTSGTYLDTIPNTAGCDSLITINLTVNTTTSSTITPTACDTYLSPGGKTLTTSGTYLDTIPNTAGCDSLITINLTVNTTTSSTIAPTACDIYQSPGGRILTTSGTYLDTIPNTAGCDSLITINLTIDTVDVSVVNNSPSLVANASDATYQWLDCNDGFAVISGATTQNYLPATNGSYAVEVSQGACVDTSACEVVGNVAILKNDFGSDLLLYPNPTMGKVVIELGKSYDDILLSLHNQVGQEVWRRYYGTGHRIEFPLEEEAGVYLLSIRSGDKVAQLKVIKR